MTTIIQRIETAANDLVGAGTHLHQTLETFGWLDNRPLRTDEITQEQSLVELMNKTSVPAQVLIPTSFIQEYHHWYGRCLALVETNIPSRLKELQGLHNQLSAFCAQPSMSFADQITAATNISQIQGIIGSVPAYVRGRLHDLELAVATTYVTDQLTEAATLLKAGYVRAAGAVAGVLLERHLKLLCDRHQPRIAYPAAATISKLNDLLKDASVYDTAHWRKIQWMGDIRNTCDHARTAEPRKEDVADLIAEVRKFVNLFSP